MLALDLMVFFMVKAPVPYVLIPPPFFHPNFRSRGEVFFPLVGEAPHMRFCNIIFYFLRLDIFLPCNRQLVLRTTLNFSLLLFQGCHTLG